MDLIITSLVGCRSVDDGTKRDDCSWKGVAGWLVRESKHGLIKSIDCSKKPVAS